MRARLLLPLLAALSACHSAPSRFYELTAEPGPARLARSTGGNTTVALGRVDLPGALDRPELARRSGPNRLDYAEDERWAGPLDTMVRRVLAEDLASRLPPGMALIDGSSGQPADLTISLDVDRFDADETGRATLAARWQSWSRTAAQGLPHDRTIVEPGAGPAAAAIAATMSHALAELAADIAAGLR
jgi:uncharacterized protein